LLASADCESAARVAKTIYLKYRQSGRTRLPNSTEAIYYKRASDLLLQELAVALGESIEEIQNRIEKICSPDTPMKWNL
jgi:RNA polymerase-interacting CarD/CdnL/TRCF family regulator